MQAVSQIARAINQSLDPTAVLRAAVDAIPPALRVDAAIIRQLDPDSGSLTLVASTGLSEDFVIQRRVLRFGEGLAGRVVLRDAPLVVDDVQADGRSTSTLRAEGIRSAAVLPIHARGRPLGTLSTLSYAPHRFGIDDLELLQTIADQVGIAIENARLYAAEHARAQQLAELARLKDEFAATISHELRTPMTVVKTAFDALVRNWETLSEPRRLEYVRAGRAGADRLKRLLENLLAVARIEESGASVRVAPLRLAPVVVEAVQEIVARHGRRVTAAVPDELPPVIADGVGLREVLVHLLDNAARYSDPPSAIELDGRPDDNSVVLAVRDRGVGIRREDLPRLFGRFERADRTVRSEAGIGLGLYIARRLVEAMNGSIWVDSEVGVGSTFYVRLPTAS